MPHPIKRYINTCKICNKFFEIQLSLKTRKVTCSKECSSIHKSNMRIGKKHNLNPIYKKCIRCYVDYQTNGTIKKHSKSKYCSNKCKNDAHSERISKEKHPNWKGGITQTNSRTQYKREIYAWRLSVFKRDFYKCKHCGSKKQLEAHHIIEWSKSVELRFDIDNGLTLCINCHGKVHNTNFGIRTRKNKQL